MSSKTSIETFFYIGLDKLSLYVFEGIDKNIFTKELSINPIEENQNIDILIDDFLGKNIIQVEKKINRFINELNLIISDQNFILIQASIKKNGKGDKLGKKDLNYMLLDLKQQIKENNLNKSITHMRIDNFQIDKIKYLTIDDYFECNELCLQIDFVCLPNEIIDNFSKKINRYQVRIDKIFSAEYLRKYYNNRSENECKMAARLKYENDENEVHLIKKNYGKIGFFERFFRFFG